ncbi:C-C motif chemokine 18 [Ictalurus punctatus]|uniref:C-C motif chemokine 18 n=1 Tax=Ictalurus punctatus TaxID=7998 RepID=A0A1V0JI28_ICTPU|nr:C-C motif chemokine 18 [Ictalurus punctatus]ARD08891.1 chemokine (C-C motif) ligand 36, duplicate 13 protein [Ictalurus punctatus]
MFFRCLLLVLVCLQDFTTDADTANGASLCCFEFHKKPFPAANVVSYEETRSDCMLPGVILTTKKGYRICADPEVDWVKQIIANKNLAKTPATN